MDSIDGSQGCCHVDRRIAGQAGGSIRLSPNLSQLHLVDPATPSW